jgi:toxin ParE1/3/4
VLPAYRFSRLARLDLIEIADYTLDTWGEEQAYRYLDGLDECFQLLAQSPQIGRPCDRIRSGYRRIEHQKHVVFYRIEKDGVFIGRILHQRMLPSSRLLDDLRAE